MDNLWGILTIVGPIILIVAIAGAMLRNRRTPRAEAKTEAATARMYDQQDRDDKAEEAGR